MEFAEDEFLKDLEDLYQAAYAETDDMKEIVRKIVPTYNLRKEDVARDQKIQAGWKKDFHDTGSTKLPEAFLNRGVADVNVEDTEEEPAETDDFRKLYVVDDVKMAEVKRRVR